MPLAIEKDKKYTYKDISNTPENERWELIDGVPYLQATPSPLHQSCGVELTTQFRVFLRGKPCKVLYEIAVWLDLKPNDNRKASSRYVAPDIIVVCDKDKIKNDGIYGVPNLIIEILSPSTAGFDFIKKYNQYFSVGLGEYWIVDPQNKVVHVFVLKDGEYKSKVYTIEDKVPVGIFNGELQIDLNEVFPIEVVEEDIEDEE